jgi:DNA repair exonuclease SbcCD ATPase subunit
MGIENIMYFALGLLAAGLVALAIMPAVWRRAVRLTKKRIEAATPITMAEFRADKDQLRAEFALSTRRLEMNVEALRRRLSDQLRDINRKRTEVGTIRGERDNHLQQMRELEEREAELRRRILDLEKDGADLAQRLRMRDREYADKAAQLETAREALRGKLPKTIELDGKALSGDYNRDMDSVLGKLDAERKRVNYLEEQNRGLITQLEAADKRHADAADAAAELRESLARKDDTATDRQNELIDAEARIADAEARVSTVLADTARVVDQTDGQREQLLAEKLAIEDELERLRTKVLTVETTIMADWDSERIEQSHMREKLNDIAAEVSRLVYAVEGEVPDSDETLLERVQKYSDDTALLQKEEPRTPEPVGQGSALSDRLAALKDIQSRN